MRRNATPGPLLASPRVSVSHTLTHFPNSQGCGTFRRGYIMCERSIGIIVAACISVMSIALGVLLSWLTTHLTWIGTMPLGEWTIRVHNRQGIALGDAYLTLVSKTGEPLSYGAGASGLPTGPFDNYTGPGSVRADHDGVLSLRNTRARKYGGSCWKLLWIWRIGSDPYTGPLTLVIEISAPRYKAARVSVRELFSQKEITIALGTNN